MQFGIRSLSALALGLALTCTVANAQLLLSGYTTGSFDDLGQANTTVVNSADGSTATFHTGKPGTGSTQTKIDFANANFTDVGYGDPIQVGLFTITNGMTLIGSGAQTARFNVGLQLTSPEMQTVAISKINFHIDHTINLQNNHKLAIADVFGVSFVQPAPITVADFLVQFHVSVDPQLFQIAENATIQKGDITVTFTPVPEPSTYAAWGAALLVGFVAYRRVRGEKLQPGLAITA